MSKLRLMRPTHGDELVAEWEPLIKTSCEAARGRFAEVVTAGRMAFRIDGPGLSVPITEFDPEAAEILVVPAIQGGATDLREHVFVPWAGADFEAFWSGDRRAVLVSEPGLEVGQWFKIREKGGSRVVKARITDLAWVANTLSLRLASLGGIMWRFDEAALSGSQSPTPEQAGVVDGEPLEV